MLFAKGTAGLHENVPGPGKDELLRRVVVGHVEVWPCLTDFSQHVLAGVNGQHARVPGRLGLQIGHMVRTGLQDVPAYLRGVDTGEAEGDELAEGMTTDEGWLQPQRAVQAPLRKLQQEKVRLLPAGQSYGLDIGLIHKGEHIPVGTGCQTIHGIAGGGKIVIQFTAHARPDHSLAAAHHGQMGRQCIPP